MKDRQRSHLGIGTERPLLTEESCQATAARPSIGPKHLLKSVIHSFGIASKQRRAFKARGKKQNKRQSVGKEENGLQTRTHNMRMCFNTHAHAYNQY